MGAFRERQVLMFERERNSMAAGPDPDALAELQKVIILGMKRHQPRLDAWSYNIATVVALAATSAATIIPYPIWAKVAAAVATFLIATTRAMDLGGRWRWRWEMRMGYQMLLDSTDEIEILPDDEKPAALRKVYAGLKDMRRREGNIPGTSTVPEKI